MNLNLEMEMSEPELCASLQDCQKSKPVRFTGTWRLAPHRAMSLRPRRASQILMVQGCAWITWSSPIVLGGLSAGDHFVQPGQILDVPAGAHLVLEARHAGQTLHFDWRELPVALAQRESRQGAMPELRRQWWQALGQLGWATGQLLRGLWPVAGCGHVVSCADACATRLPS